MTIELIGLEHIPIVDNNDDIALIIKDAINKQGCLIQHGDIILIAETLISKAEGNFIKLDDLVPSKEALELAEKSQKDPKLVEAILQESNEVVRVGPKFIITETKHGFICANAGIDESNVGDGLATPMPVNPDKSALEIRKFLEKEFNQEIAVIITDTQGRAFRFGAIGTAIGCSGISPLWRRVGEKDLYGRELETTEIATADELSAAASLVMGQANEGLPVVIIRGFSNFDDLRNEDSKIDDLIMQKEFDVFR
ncbi:coenzyme F420-0:L-glutamate ligase [Methanobrevibacter sp.]|uniref:coenzyme F420-0:L-glutamate ligase n=1 Tax=Methanobrevibacter sp. TaxID=66852 RepID=UPI0038901A3E